MAAGGMTMATAAAFLLALNYGLCPAAAAGPLPSAEDAICSATAAPRDILFTSRLARPLQTVGLLSY